MCSYCTLDIIKCGLKLSLHKSDISPLLFTQHPTQGPQLFYGFMRQAKNVFIHMQQYSLSDYRTGNRTETEILMARAVPRRSTNLNTTLKQIKHNRKKTVQNNALTLLLFVALCKHTAFIVSKQSGCVFLSNWGKPPLQCPLKEHCIKVSYRQHNISKGTE